MSQLVVRPGRNAAREAKRLKEIRKVQGAIVWHERERKKRQKLVHERWETRQAWIERLKWEHKNVYKLNRRALYKAQEDWRLGPLRPNRAIGEAAGKYGAITKEQAQKPQIPVHTHKELNEQKIKRGLEPEYPLVVDDKKYFHIEKDDRVVVVNGREKGKIGIVQEIISATHEVIVKDVNKQYYDSNLFNYTVENLGPKRESEVPMSIADVRLVIPYQVTKIMSTKNELGEVTEKPVKCFQDVIVDKVTLERHTTGIDPFTGTNYGNNEIPKDHQYDPATGLPIFHRYIAGTRHRIEWPWEKDTAIDDVGVTEDAPVDQQTWIRRTLNTVRHPITSLRRAKARRATRTTTAAAAEKIDIEQAYSKAEDDALRDHRDKTPKSKDPKFAEAWDVTDTTRYVVEQGESASYTLVAPPFPHTLGEELRADIAEMRAEERKKLREEREEAKKNGKVVNQTKPKRVTEQALITGEDARSPRAAVMKTPMQLRWEMEQARKLKAREEAPLVSSDELMKALGKHMIVQKRKTRLEKTMLWEKTTKLRKEKGLVGGGEVD